MKFHHIALSVSNIQVSKNFYTSALSFSIHKEYSKDGTNICILKGYGMYLELFQFLGMKAMPEHRNSIETDLKVIGVKHFALCSEDFQPDIERLKNAGVEINAGPKEGRLVKQYAFFKDPDGILFELLEE